MPSYCLDRQTRPGSESHQVHDLSSTHGCLPAPANRIALGSHLTCVEAAAEAAGHADLVDGCRWCTPSCHRG